MSEPANFDRVARVYKWCEYLALGPLLERTRLHWLPQVKHARCAWILGDGDGRFTEKLLAASTHLEATAVDTSGRMLQLLRRRCARFGGRLQTRQQTALDATPAVDIDLIVTHFFLDCLTQSEVDALAARLSALTKPGGLWLLSDFAVPQKRMIRLAAQAYIRALYFAFRVLTGLRVTRLPDPQGALLRADFERVARHEALRGVLYTELWRRK